MQVLIAITDHCTVTIGIPSRKEIHQRLDLGFLIVTSDDRFLVGQSLVDEWQDGSANYLCTSR